MAEKGVKQIWFTPLATANDSTDKEGIGVLRLEGANIYQYVKADTTGVTLGNLITISEGHVVTKMAAGTANTTTLPKAIAMATLTSNYYGWALRAGVANVTKTVQYPVTKGMVPLSVTKTAGLLGSFGGTTQSPVFIGVAILTAGTTGETTVSCMVAFL